MASDEKRTVNPVVKVWLALHVLLITLWTFPMSPPSYRIFLDPGATPRQLANAPQPTGLDRVLVANDRYVRNNAPVRTYLLSTGLWQYWDMFAPNPLSTDFWIDMRVRYADGTEATYDYPRMETMSVTHKFFMERYRKFMERGHADSFPQLKPTIARKVAREMNVNPLNPPREVVLVRHWRSLEGPGKPIPPYNRTEFYRYLVQPEDLK